MASGDSIDTIEVLESSYTKKHSRTHSGMKQANGEDDDKDKSLSVDKNIPHDVSSTIGDGKMATNVSRSKSDKERKIGHRRVGVGGEITYKKIQTSQIMGSIQLGIQHAVGGLASKPERDLLMQDFMTVETTNFPHEGSNHTPAHHYSEFKYKNYAPIAFRYFRDLFGIQPDDFLISMCSSPLRELSNPGASGSIFYLTDDDEFIIKTVQHKEGEFLQKLLPGYYMNLNQNPRTLLPKFFGLYCYQCNSKNVRLCIMNNLLPSAVTLHQKYDLKGSTYKRKASKSEKAKKSPTYKDLDFMEHHAEGILLEADTYNALIKTIQRDCRVLESFKIMDYSLLVGIHNLDQAQREKLEKRSQMNLEDVPEEHEAGDAMTDATQHMLDKERDREREDRIGAAALNRSRSINKQRLVAHSTAMESIQAESEPIDEEDDVPPGGIPARNAKGERLLLFIGIIDILQSYRLKKKLEHTWKSMIHDGDTVSVHRPGFYAQRFQDFMAKTVFKKIPSPLKHSPSKRKSLSRPLRAHDELESSVAQAPSGQQNGSKVASPEDPKCGSPPAYTVTNNTNIPSSTPPTITSPPSAYPAVLVGRPTTTQSEQKPKIPPPVPPRGTPKAKRGSIHDKGLAPSCCSTPPPTFEEVLEQRAASTTMVSGSTPIRSRVGSHVTHVAVKNYREDAVSITDIRLESRAENKSSLSVESGSSGAGHSRGMAWTPPASVEGSTPTWTEGTPSFTESSSSGDMGCPTTPVRQTSSSPSTGHHKQAVERALNCLTSEMTHL